MNLTFRPGCNGPYAECDYKLLIESLKPFADDWTLSMVASDILSNTLESVQMMGTPGMQAVGHELEACGVLIWLHEEQCEIEVEQICISKAGLTFGTDEATNPPDKFMIPESEIKCRLELLRLARSPEGPAV